MNWVPVIITGMIILSVAGTVVYVRLRIRRFSRSIFGTDSLIDGYKQQQQRVSATPKSVSAMTRIFLPQIKVDFPEFNYEEFKIKAENMLVSALTAISENDLGCIKDASPDLVEKVRLIIENNQSQLLNETYKDIKIYQTEITDYRKQSGTCVITLQSAVSYMHYCETDGKIVSGSTELTEQCKYNIDIVYIQDSTKLESGDSTAVGTNCPNCGAPITNLGQKYCIYCHTAIRVVNINVWKINNFRKL